jgi:hypothetical protein
VFVSRVDSPQGLPKRIPVAKDIASLLKQATEALGMRRPAVQAYDEQSLPINSIADVRADMSLFVAAVVPTPDSWEEPSSKSRLHRETSPKTTKVVTRPKPKPRPDNAVEHQVIAASRSTSKENLRDALTILYPALTPEHKAHLPIGPSLQKLTDDAQQFSVENSMQSQFIGPSTMIAQTELGQKTIAWVMARLKGLNLEEYRFVITGPSQSGRSTLLSLFVSLFHQRLQVACKSSKYLIVPFNWYFHQIEQVSVPKFFELVVSQTLNALRAARPEIIPIIGILQQWLLSLLTVQTFPGLIVPQTRKSEPSWYQGFVEIGKRIHHYWNRKDTTWAEGPIQKAKRREDINFFLFLNEICALPQRIARVFDFISAVLVYDHFDVASFDWDPGDHFPDSTEPVPLFLVLWNAAKDGPFFISSRNDEQLLRMFRQFDIEDYTQLSTEGLIQGGDARALIVPQVGLTLSIDSCRGCPAYIALYKKVVGMAVECQEKAAVKSQYSLLRSVVDVSRGEMLRLELVRLAVLLANANVDWDFEEDRINVLLGLADFTVKIH